MEENIDYSEWQTVYWRTGYGEYQVEEGNGIRFLYSMYLLNPETIFKKFF